MTNCWACDAQLDPVWKFCTQCGVPLERDAEVPAAIRPDAVAVEQPLSPLAVFGWIMAGIGAAVVIGGVVLFLILR